MPLIIFPIWEPLWFRIWGRGSVGVIPIWDTPTAHGRAEYISALVVAFLIIFVGLELLRSAADRILHPTPVTLHPLMLILLLVSLPVKWWMWSYNRFLGREIDSRVLLAASKDSLNDVIATSAILLSALLSPLCSFPLDGVMGLIVSALILWSGYTIARDTIDRLLGRRPEESLLRKIEELVLENSAVLGMHDLRVHDYGPGCIIASVHAEVSDEMTLVEGHRLIDAIEKRILKEMNVDIVIHMDPIKIPQQEQ